MILAFVFDWWNELSLAKQIFYGIGLLAGFMTLIIALMTMFGLDHHDSMDGDISDGHGFGDNFIAVKPLTGFFLGFGWGGGLALDYGLTIPVATLCGLAFGGTIMLGIVGMIRVMLRFRSDGTMQVDKTVGCVGTVYITLPASKAPGGQVIVNFSGRQETFDALNTADRSIASGEKIRVSAVIDGRTLLVEPLA